MVDYIPKTLINKHQGFTLIEMVMVIIIIGILSVVALPKFFDASGFEEYAYRAESISALRAIQLRAMQNTDASVCHQVLITAKILGEPDKSRCEFGDAPVFSDEWLDDADDNTSVVINQASVSYTVGSDGQYFEFDSLGRPDCLCTVNILISGETNLVIRIESEGYIHGI